MDLTLPGQNVDDSTLNEHDVNDYSMEESNLDDCYMEELNFDDSLIDCSDEERPSSEPKRIKYSSPTYPERPWSVPTQSNVSSIK